MSLHTPAKFGGDRTTRLDANPGYTDRHTDTQTSAAYYIDEGELPMSRTAKRKSLRQDHPGETPEDYFRQTVGIPLPDHLAGDGLLLAADQAATVQNAGHLPQGIKRAS